ncbi:MAG: ribonuclease R [Nitrospirota bacterium]
MNKKKKKAKSNSPEKEVITGKLEGHPDGYGFVVSDASDDEDIFISPKKMNGAMHGDIVEAEVRQLKIRRKREGRIKRIIEREYTTIIGRFETYNKDYGVVMPHNKRIFHSFYISSENRNSAENGDMVVAEITRYPARYRDPEGRIIEIMGKAEESKIDTDIIIREFELRRQFPEDVIKEAMSLPGRVGSNMLKERVDLRRIKTVTIDGEKAKDFDDAISIERLPSTDQIRLWVHIADVAYYSARDTALDSEAYIRGTSIYFPDKVLPMFPEELSNGICSLSPKKDRLTITLEMLFDSDGTLAKYDIYESAINSNERMTYADVRDILVKKESSLYRRYSSLIEDFRTMEELSLRLKKKRVERGSIDFDLPEPEIHLDLQGEPLSIIYEERNIAHQIIEEFMLIANETIARHLSNLNLPMIYRIHEEPDKGSITEFNAYISNFGLALRETDRLKPGELQRLLNEVKERPEERLINNLLLRCMKQARYSSDNKRHFGLASSCYTHFTSPIRRYPDLIVHRILKETIKGVMSDHQMITRLKGELPAMAKYCSERERIAVEAEREAVHIKKIRFIADKVGEERNGFISGVTRYGFFVELENIFVEGLVHVKRLHDDYYIYSEKEHSLIGERRKKIFRIGDKVRVRIDRVDLTKREVDFVYIE